MGLLSGSTAYLAGAIEFAQSPTSWREQIKRELLLPLGIRPYDPLMKPSFMSEAAKGDPSDYRKLLTVPKEQDKIWSALSEIRDIDRQYVYACDLVICSLPKMFTVGTFEELTIAATCNKPVLVHCPDGLISTWLPPMLARSSTEYWSHVHFNSWEVLYEHIRQIDNGDIEVDKLKWIFVSYFNDPSVKARITEINNAINDA